jgi:hypothetical protein
MFREFTDGADWLKNDVHAMGLDEEGKILNNCSFTIEQTRDQEALQICRLIAHGALCLSAVREKGHVDSDLANLVTLSV